MKKYITEELRGIAEAWRTAPFSRGSENGSALRRSVGPLLLFAPLALVLGLVLRWTQPAPPPLGLQYGRSGWVDLTRASAQRLGLDTGAWRASVQIEQQENAVRHYARTPDRSQLRQRLHPPTIVKINLQEPGGAGKFEARLAPSGDVLGWSLEGQKGDGPQHTPVETAQNWLKPYGAVTLSDWRDHADDDDRRKWDAEARFVTAPKESYRVELGVRGDRVVAWSVQDENGGDGDSTIAGFEEFLRACGGTLTGLFLIYSLRLFRRRRREGEIPRERVWVLIAVFGACGGLFVALNPEYQFNGSSTVMSIGRAVLGVLTTSVLYAVGGLFVSAAYASGEGEIREGWPGKLISLDALLAGRWFTRPVGISAVLAAAIAAWAFCIAACAWRLDPPQASLLIDKDLLEVAMGRNLLLRSLTDLPLRVSFLIVAGLFMPLAFIHRRRWTGWKVWAILMVCPFLVDGAFRTFSLSGIGPVVSSLGVIVALVMPFYVLDVLAAVLGALLYTALMSATAIATAAPGVASTEALLLVAITAGLLPLMAAAWRGQAVDERAVRPTYARNLAERLSLKAEVSAAREAQLRLLPAAMPQQAGLSVAAYCQPAGVVGGDFYDFIQAPNGQLGVFLASGSGMGLASALTIALAKGFLASQVRRGEDPGASMKALLKELSGRVGAAAEETGLLVALLDPARGDVRLARRGKYPAVWWMRGRECAPVELNGNPEGRVETGSVEWQSGDVLVLSTEGFTALLADQSLSGQRRWLNTTARRTIGAQAGQIEYDLMRRLGGRRGKRLRKLRRDLTTVVLRKQPA